MITGGSASFAKGRIGIEGRWLVIGVWMRRSSPARSVRSKVPDNRLPYLLPTSVEALDEVRLSVDRFCLVAGIEALQEMMEEDATAVCGARHRRHADRQGYRSGMTAGEVGYHGGKVKVCRPRVRDHAGKEVSLESWEVLRDGDLLFEWALNLMVVVPQNLIGCGIPGISAHCRLPSATCKQSS